MDRIAQASRAERAELFRRSAGVLLPERSPPIIEKDFWVCWSLYRRSARAAGALSLTRSTRRRWEPIVEGLRELEEQINRI